MVFNISINFVVNTEGKVVPDVTRTSTYVYIHFLRLVVWFKFGTKIHLV